MFNNPTSRKQPVQYRTSTASAQDKYRATYSPSITTYPNHTLSLPSRRRMRSGPEHSHQESEHHTMATVRFHKIIEGIVGKNWQMKRYSWYSNPEN